MSNTLLKPNDYRQGLGDKYGRAICDNCLLRRKINVHWQQTGRKLCKPCSHKLLGIES